MIFIKLFFIKNYIITIFNQVKLYKWIDKNKSKIISLNSYQIRKDNIFLRWIIKEMTTYKMKRREQLVRGYGGGVYRLISNDFLLIPKSN